MSCVCVGLPVFPPPCSLAHRQSVMYCALCNGWVTRWTPEGEGRPGHTQPISLPLCHRFSLTSSILLFSFSTFAYCFQQQTCVFVGHCNYFLLGMHTFFSSHKWWVCVCIGEKESGLCPQGLSVSLIKDRRLTEREYVARLACRPQQQHTSPAVWRERANRRKWLWRGLLMKRKLDVKWRKMVWI